MPATKGDLVKVPVKLLVESKLNPREMGSADADKEFLASVKEHGILVPLTLRKHNGKYEVLAGSRRHDAAKKAGISHISATVVEVSDTVAREIVIIDNLQRKDLHPLDEADGLSALLAEYKGDVAKVASRTGKKKEYIAQRARITELVSSWRKLWMAPDSYVTVQMAIDVAKLPADQQEDLYRQTKRHGTDEGRLWDIINEEKILALKRAPWNMEDEKLYPKAGSCAKCPKRTTNAKDLFGEVKADSCSDRTCFMDKLRLHAETLSKGEGGKVWMFTSQYHSKNSGVLSRENAYVITNKKECGKMVRGLNVELEDKDFGKIVLICRGGSQCTVHRNQEERDSIGRPKISKVERIKRMKKNSALRLKLAEAHKTFDHVLAKWKTNLEDVRELAETFWNRLWHDNTIKVAMRHKWIEKASQLDYNYDIRKRIDVMKTEEEVLRFMMECAFVNEINYNGTIDDTIKGLAKRLKVDSKQVSKEVAHDFAVREAQKTTDRKARAEAKKLAKAKLAKKKKK